MIEHACQGAAPNCARCGEPREKHRAPRRRAYHASVGDPCERCSLPSSAHRPDKDRRRRVAYDAARKVEKAAYDAERADDRHADRKIIGVDGEGKDTPDGRHVYTYLAAVDEHGRLVAEARNPDGLSHEECVTMLLAIPRNSLKFGFMFSYDVTKITEQMPASDVYYLMRPNARTRRSCKACDVKWDALNVRECPSCGGTFEVRSFTRSVRYRGRKYGFFNGSLSISTIRKPVRNVKIWDCFRFFGCSFVEALKDWAIGTPEEIATIADMKGKRGAFDQEDASDVEAYCRRECHLLALMMRKVVDSHARAGIPLERYDGAGSTASALLKKHEVADFKGPKLDALPRGLAHAVRAAFFGGRFENSTIGTVEGACHGYDISSAYPYALSFLPCLACGRWKLRKLTAKSIREIVARGDLVLARYFVRPVSAAQRKRLAWCPLPFRDEHGSITYGTNFEGWAWAPELLAALDGWPDLVKLGAEAWVYERPKECRKDHQPFGFLPQVYRQRLAWGKEGAGKALKLGSNATYGKTAQSIGEDPPFQSWIWAGMTTATTRGQLLGAIASARDPWNIFSVATDGIFGREELHLPTPRDTGTFDLVKDNKPCPLGGWEHKDIREGMFFAKPGLYFRLGTTLGEIRARGVGRREVFEHRTKLVESFASWDRANMGHSLRLTSRRFYGAKHSIYAQSACIRCRVRWPGVPEQGCPKCGEVGDDFQTKMLEDEAGNVAFGRWGVRTTDVRFDPHPKRERVIAEGGSYARLHVRDLGGRASAAYEKGRTTPEGFDARSAQDFNLEQPDWFEAKGHQEELAL